jgi:hypothetical protein
LAEAERMEQAVELTLQLAKGREGGAQGQGEAMLMAKDEAQGDTQPEALQGKASPLGRYGRLSTTEELGDLGQG